MSYVVYLKKSAEKELDHLPTEVYDRTIKQQKFIVKAE